MKIELTNQAEIFSVGVNKVWWVEQVNLSGGYYDAGDNVKFGWPMAFSVSLLSWTATEFGNEIDSADELANLRIAIRWGADFLLRAHTSSTTLYTQVIINYHFLIINSNNTIAI